MLRSKRGMSARSRASKRTRMKPSTLPEEVIFYHILPKLPAKCLLRFRCVSKSWNCFIQHPHFVQLFQSTNRHLLFVSSAPGTPVGSIHRRTSHPHVFQARLHDTEAAISPARPTDILTIPNLDYSHLGVQSVNGLLCFHAGNYTSRYPRGASPPINIVNPTTRQIITLPDDTSVSDEFMASTHFGFDPIRDEFKVLRLLRYRASFQFKIITVGGANSWRHLTQPAVAVPVVVDKWSGCPLRNLGVCVSGAIHWLSSSQNLIAFDVGCEQFRTIPLPDGCKGRMQLRPRLAELGACLGLIDYSELKVLNLWILKDYQSQQWIKERITVPYPIFNIVFPRGNGFAPLCEVGTDEILILPCGVAVGDRDCRCYSIYNLKEKIYSSSVETREMRQVFSRARNVFFYRESFRLLKLDL